MIGKQKWETVYRAVEAKMRGAPAGEPETFIQWKGTNVCLDFHCPCGHHSHWDCDFIYSLRCPGCRKIWRLGTRVQAVEISEADAEVLGCLKESDEEAPDEASEDEPADESEEQGGRSRCSKCGFFWSANCSACEARIAAPR